MTQRSSPHEAWLPRWPARLSSLRETQSGPRFPHSHRLFNDETILVSIKPGEV